MKQPSPLGRYAAITAAVVVVMTVAAALVSHLLGRADGFLDQMAFLCIVAVIGTGAALTQLNGTVRRTEEQDALIAQQGAQLAAQAAELAALREHVKV